ncbi:MAG: hypothetical protein LBI31_07495 [Zoogloeaceae bacterium]|jgi:hypothetical protein|nr:hypothetical protein [Zoogloeaceae bacterium]
MPHLISHVVNNQITGKPAHAEFIAAVQEFAEYAGWQTVRRNDTTAPELILKGFGHTGSEEIYVGLKTYENAQSDWYNLLVGCFAGYVGSNSFENQPGAMISGVPAHNQRIDFWLTVNPQRIAAALKVGSPVYESFYLGKMLPYCRPSQYPLPLVCAGMLNGAATTRYSDTAHSIPYKGNRANLKLRTLSGIVQPYSYPWQNARFSTPPSSNSVTQAALRDTGGQYPLLPVELNDNSGNLYGMLDGVYFTSGFNNVVESTLAVADGTTHVVINDVYRTGFADYYALRLDP